MKDNHVVIHVFVELPIDAVIRTEQGESAVAAYRKIVDADAHTVFEHRPVTDETGRMGEIYPQLRNIGPADEYPLHLFARIGGIITPFVAIDGNLQHRMFPVDEKEGGRIGLLDTPTELHPLILRRGVLPGNGKHSRHEKPLLILLRHALALYQVVVGPPLVIVRHRTAVFRQRRGERDEADSATSVCHLQLFPHIGSNDIGLDERIAEHRYTYRTFVGFVCQRMVETCHHLFVRTVIRYWNDTGPLHTGDRQPLRIGSVLARNSLRSRNTRGIHHLLYGHGLEIIEDRRGEQIPIGNGHEPFILKGHDIRKDIGPFHHHVSHPETRNERNAQQQYDDERSDIKPASCIILWPRHTILRYNVDKDKKKKDWRTIRCPPIIAPNPFGVAPFTELSRRQNRLPETGKHRTGHMPSNPPVHPTCATTRKHRTQAQDTSPDSVPGPHKQPPARSVHRTTHIPSDTHNDTDKPDNGRHVLPAGNRQTPPGRTARKKAAPSKRRLRIISFLLD